MSLYDSAITGKLCYFVAITETEFISGYVDKRSLQKPVLSAFQAGHEPLAVLYQVHAMGRSARRLSDLQSLEYHTDNCWLKARFRDPESNKDVTVETVLNSKQSREIAVQTIKAKAGIKFYQTLQPASVWHVGHEQFIMAAIALLIFVGIGIAAQFGGYDPEFEINAPRGPGRQRGDGLGRMLASLCLTVGPIGMILIGLGIAAAMLVWFWINWQKNPLRISLVPDGVAHKALASDT